MGKIKYIPRIKTPCMWERLYGGVQWELSGSKVYWLWGCSQSMAQGGEVPWLIIESCSIYPLIIISRLLVKWVVFWGNLRRRIHGPPSPQICPLVLHSFVSKIMHDPHCCLGKQAHFLIIYPKTCVVNMCPYQQYDEAHVLHQCQISHLHVSLD